MKKKLLSVLLAAGLSMSMIACGAAEKENEENVTNTPTGTSVENDNGEEKIRFSGKGTIESYKGIEYEPYVIDVKEQDVLNQIVSFTTSHAQTIEVTDHTDVRDGDVVDIGYIGSMDGEEFENTPSYNLTIGSGRFIEGFEDQLIGANKGDVVDVNVTFPDPYPVNPDFSGKPANFKVTINRIVKIETPELNDELVAEYTECKTVGEYKEYVKEQLTKQQEDYAKIYNEGEILKNAVAKTTYEGIDQADIDKYYSDAKQYYEQLGAMYQSMYGYSFEMFTYYFFGTTDNTEYETMLMENAEYEVKKSLMLYDVIEKENLTLTDEEFQAVLDDYANQYGITKEEFLANAKEEKVRDHALEEKAQQIIIDNAVAKAAEKTE